MPAAVLSYDLSPLHVHLAEVNVPHAGASAAGAWLRPAAWRAGRARSSPHARALVRSSARAQVRPAISRLLLSSCAIIGGVLSFFKMLDGLVHSSARALGARL